MAPDPHSLLGLPPTAGADEIRAAYRRRAAQVHPDRHPPERKAWAAEQMRQLNAARDALLAAAARPAAEPAPEAEAFWRNVELRRRRRAAAQRARWNATLAGLLCLGAALCALAVAAPEVLGLLAQVGTALLTVGAILFVPLIVAGVLAFVLISLRNI